MILRILGIDKETIIEEYLLSEGEVKKVWIQMALDGIEAIETYFNRVDLLKVRATLQTTLLSK